MFSRNVIIAIALLAGSAQAQTVLHRTNEVGGSYADHTLTINAGALRLNTVTMEYGDVPLNMSDITTFRATVHDLTDGRLVQTKTQDATGDNIDASIGQVRFVFDFLQDRGIDPDYEIKAVAVASDTNQNYTIHWGYLSVTSAVPAADVEIHSNAFQGATFNVGGNTYNYTTNIYMSGVSNVVTGTTNHWDASNWTLHISTSEVTSSSVTFVPTNQLYNYGFFTNDIFYYGTNEVATLEGYTAQQIADLSRSTADFDYTILTWSPTVELARIDGPRQYVPIESNTWFKVPAGATNFGFAMLLEVPTTSYEINFLPDNLLIATNFYNSTNRARAFVIYNTYNEEGSGVYEVQREAE